MKFPVDGRITAKWNEMRPLTASEKTHVHGAIDIAASVNTPIYAPEKGLLYHIISIRSDIQKRWNEMDWRDGEIFPFQNYFYDLYGSLILLVGVSGLWHLFTHSWWNQLYNKNIIDKLLITYQEEKKQDRFPIASMHNLATPAFIKVGDIIGYVGNAGFSTGPHVHYEIHEGKFQVHEDRPDPEKLYTREGILT